MVSPVFPSSETLLSLLSPSLCSLPVTPNPPAWNPNLTSPVIGEQGLYNKCWYMWGPWNNQILGYIIWHWVQAAQDQLPIVNCSAMQGLSPQSQAIVFSFSSERETEGERESGSYIQHPTVTKGFLCPPHRPGEPSLASCVETPLVSRSWAGPQATMGTGPLAVGVWTSGDNTWVVYFFPPFYFWGRTSLCNLS